MQFAPRLLQCSSMRCNIAKVDWVNRKHAESKPCQSLVVVSEKVSNELNQHHCASVNICEFCPVLFLIVRSQWLSWIQILNCPNCMQCLKGHKYLRLSLSLLLLLLLLSLSLSFCWSGHVFSSLWSNVSKAKSLEDCSLKVFVDVFVIAFVFVVGQVIFSHHSDQMSQR